MRGAVSVLRVSVLLGIIALWSGPAQATPPPAEASVAPSLPAVPLTVGILPFQAEDRKLASQVSDILAADLSQDDRIGLVERARLGEVLAELGLGASGVGDPETAQKVGFLAGARVLVWGQVYVVDQHLIAIGRVVGVETGRVFVEQVRGPRGGDLVPTIDQLAALLAARILSERNALVAAEDQESLQANLNALAEKLRGIPLPTVTVLVQGEVSGSSLASTLESELMLWLVRCGVPVVEAPDQPQKAGQGSGKASPRAGWIPPSSLPEEAALLLVAEASVAPSDTYGPLQAVRYRLQVRLVNRRTGAVTAVARRAGECADLTLESASRHGLQRAATSIAAELIPNLAGIPTAPSPPASPIPAPAPPAPPAGDSAGPALLAFVPYTPEEEAATYYENGTHHHASGRAVDYDARLIYVFQIPPDIGAAACVMTVDNMFLIRVARDDGGKPGEWHEELNASKLFDRRIRNSENKMEYTIDLTPYLEDNPSRTVYLSFRPTQYYDAGTVVYRVALVALDDEERGRIEQRKRRLDRFIEQDRDQHLLVFQTDGGPAEAPYLYDGSAGYRSHLIPCGRGFERDEYVIYRVPLTRQAKGDRICALINNTFVVALALEQDGKPGEFLEAVRGAERMALDITPEMIAAGAVYLKFQYSRPADPGGIVIREISIQRP